MELPSWLPLHGIGTAVMYLGQFFICHEELVSTSGGTFATILRFVAFQGCSLDAVTGFIIFMFTGFIWLMVGLSFVLPLASGLLANPIAGSIAGVGAIALILTFIIFI